MTTNKKNNLENIWTDSLKNAQKALAELISNKDLIKKCTQLGEDLVQAFQSDRKVLICGNGGSHCDAQHFAEEFTGRYRKDRRALPAIALGDASHTTCVGNDYGFEKIFSRHTEALGQKGDVLICLTTSGNSPNVLEAITAAQKKGMTPWALLGKDGGKVAQILEKNIIVPGPSTDRIQELHMLILHIAIEHVERALFPENY